MNIVKTYYLQPIDGRKSFYNKCYVVVMPCGQERLYSYNTLVAIKKINEKIEVVNWFSNTTARHINAFLERHGEPKKQKKEMLKASY